MSLNKSRISRDLRAKLELSVDHILETCSHVENLTDTDCTSVDSSEIPDTVLSSPLITTIVRRELSIAIRDLIQHGMIERTKGSGALVPFMGCMAPKGLPNNNPVNHAWNVVMTFYKLKGGQEFNSATSRKLSQSFGLDLGSSESNNGVVGGGVKSVKQSLLTTIGQILSTHSRYKRSSDAHFKAFVLRGGSSEFLKICKTQNRQSRKFREKSDKEFIL